jgi:dihydrofolate reductase
MRRLMVTTFLTLDGVMQAPGGPGEDDSGGFTFGGWSVNYWDERMREFMTQTMRVPFDLLLGRRTYDIFVTYWPDAPEEAGSKPLNDATKFVASRGRPTLDWKESVLIEGDAADGVAALKRTDGPELQVHGSGNLIQTLMANGLIDEYRLWVFPVVLGSGKRLFADGAIPSGLRLVDSTVSTTGVVIGTYEPAGEIVTGSF